MKEPRLALSQLSSGFVTEWGAPCKTVGSARTAVPRVGGVAPAPLETRQHCRPSAPGKPARRGLASRARRKPSGCTSSTWHPDLMLLVSVRRPVAARPRG